MQRRQVYDHDFTEERLVIHERDLRSFVAGAPAWDVVGKRGLVRLHEQAKAALDLHRLVRAVVRNHQGGD